MAKACKTRKPKPSSRCRAAEGNRTLDLVLTKDALYQLSYSSNASQPTDPYTTEWPVCLELSTEERVMGIEPTPPAWKAGALPLSYTRNIFGSASESATEGTPRYKSPTDPDRALPRPKSIRLTSLHLNQQKNYDRLIQNEHGGSRIRTCEGRATRFTVWPLWPLGYPAAILSKLLQPPPSYNHRRR